MKKNKSRGSEILAVEEAAMKTELYLKQKIRANIDAIIDCGDINNIEINRSSKIIKLWSNRDVYYVDINYLIGTSAQIKKLVVKKVDAVDAVDAKKIYEEHKKIFDKIEEKNIRQLLPKPYFYIADSNYIVMDYVNGKPLLEIVLLKLAFRSYHSLINIFTNLGTSLANFHNLFKNYNSPIILDKVVNEVIEKLKNSEYFNKKEKSEIYEYLLRGNDLLGPDYKIPVSKLYNDWTLRNFIINKKSELKVIDTDAMVHPQFPDYDIIWNDISTFLVNIESQTKYYPLINKNHLLNLQKYFLDGYNAILDERYTSEEVNFLHYVAVLEFYLGMVERPLKEIYSGWPSSRYIKNLKKSITIGTGSIFGKFY